MSYEQDSIIREILTYKSSIKCLKVSVYDAPIFYLLRKERDLRAKSLKEKDAELLDLEDRTKIIKEINRYLPIDKGVKQILVPLKEVPPRYLYGVLKTLKNSYNKTPKYTIKKYKPQVMEEAPEQITIDDLFRRKSNEAIAEKCKEALK